MRQRGRAALPPGECYFGAPYNATFWGDLLRNVPPRKIGQPPIPRWHSRADAGLNAAFLRRDRRLPAQPEAFPLELWDQCAAECIREVAALAIQRRFRCHFARKLICLGFEQERCASEFWAALGRARGYLEELRQIRRCAQPLFDPGPGFQTPGLFF